VNPADQTVVAGLIRLAGQDATVRSDQAPQGGVRVSSPDGRLVITNTLTFRLERARPSLAAQVARVLWE